MVLCWRIIWTGSGVIAWFSIVRPTWGDVGTLRVEDGDAQHQGIEANAAWGAGLNGCDPLAAAACIARATGEEAR